MKLFASALVSIGMMAAVPSTAIAQTSSASKLSVVSARAGARGGDSRLEGGSGGVIAIALLAGIAAIAVLAAVNNDDSPNSP
ncbi:hypothetical protein ACFSCW_01685 [Sphingomonas tabacisoli]|uniref:Uncharacterized protein n=1 Tax=Sphingomonas tabacisoli TaxID=2249466 RepID=A0ABW4HXZ6_9SPHN